MMGPRTADAAVMAQEKSSSYPTSRMASISMFPRPPASATAVPDIPAKSMEQMMFAWPMPPGTVPTMVLAKRNSFLVTPLVFMKLPIRIKNGQASMVKEFAACVILCTTTMGLSPDMKMYRNEVSPRLTYRGRPVNRRITNNVRQILILHPLLYHDNPSVRRQSTQ